MNKQTLWLVTGVALQMTCAPAWSEETTEAVPKHGKAQNGHYVHSSTSKASKHAKAEKPWEKVKRHFPPDVKAPEAKPAKST